VIGSCASSRAIKSMTGTEHMYGPYAINNGIKNNPMLS